MWRRWRSFWKKEGCLKGLYWSDRRPAILFLLKTKWYGNDRSRRSETLRLWVRRGFLAATYFRICNPPSKKKKKPPRRSIVIVANCKMVTWFVWSITGTQLWRHGIFGCKPVTHAPRCTYYTGEPLVQPGTVQHQSNRPFCSFSHRNVSQNLSDLALSLAALAGDSTCQYATVIYTEAHYEAHFD